MSHAHAHSHEFEVKKLDRLSGTRVRMTVEFAPKTVLDEEMRTAKKYLNGAKMPGFRPGKAPMDMVFRQFEKEILKDALTHLLEHGFQEACEQSKLIPIGEPKMQFGTRKLREEQPFAFEAEFDVRPEIDLAHYKGIPVQEATGDVTEEEVTKAIDELRDRQADLEPSTETVAKRGLFAVVELGYRIVDGSKESKPEPLTVEIGGGRLLDELDKALDGAKVGVEQTVRTKFPADADPSIAGKDTDFTLKITELKAKKMPAFDDAFAATLKEGATAEELKKDLRERIASQKKRAAERAQRDQLIEYLVAKHKFEVPRSLVDQQVRRFLQSSGMKNEDLESGKLPTNLSKEQWAQMEKRAEETVRGSLLLAAVAEKEELNIEESELRARLEGIATELKRPLRETVLWLEERGMLRQLQDELLTEKVFSFLLEHAERLPQAP